MLRQSDFTYQYKCDECGEIVSITPAERVSRFGIQCSYCGSRRLEAQNRATKRAILRTKRRYR